MMPVSDQGPFRNPTQLFRLAVIAAVATIWTNSRAEAAFYYWRFQQPSYFTPFFKQPRPSIRHHSLKPIKVPEQDLAKPRGPVIIAISIEKQSLKLYDADGAFAQTPISTGRRGHPTPMGVFSIIQKQRFHRSNIYSDAPMPYMQRITWSGIALHAGVVPGHPASHGCIRVPTSFAMKMWRWTKVGARVVITPGETSPAGFSHRLLPMHRVSPNEISAITSAAPAQLAAKVENAAQGAPVKEFQGGTASGAVAPTVTVDKRTTGTSTTLSDASLSSPQPLAPLTGMEALLPDSGKAGLGHPSELIAPALKRSMPIAVFISRKDAKLYVRQNFTPLFELPVTIAGSDRPLGTHVFTAQVDPIDASVLRWSVLSLPSPTMVGQRSHGHKFGNRLEVQPPALPDGPAEALDRLIIPADFMARIADALSAGGGSIIISDRGIRSGETGAGTDFIVSLQ